MNRGQIYKYLETEGFQLIKKGKSDSFGDYFDIYSNGNILIRFSSSKLLETVDICSVSDQVNWFDMALLKFLLFKENDLKKATSLYDYLKFIETELYNIIELFSKDNYSVTKEKLKKLEHKRVKQLFSETGNKAHNG